MRWPAPILSLVLCAGCLWKRPEPAPCPPPPHVPRPELKYPCLPPTATLVEIVTALVLDTIARDGYERSLEAIIEAYRPVEPAKAVPAKKEETKKERPNG